MCEWHCCCDFTPWNLPNYVFKSFSFIAKQITRIVTVMDANLISNNFFNDYIPSHSALRFRRPSFAVDDSADRMQNRNFFTFCTQLIDSVDNFSTRFFSSSICLACEKNCSTHSLSRRMRSKCTRTGWRELVVRANVSWLRWEQFRYLHASDAIRNSVVTISKSRFGFQYAHSLACTRSHIESKWYQTQ